MGGNYKNTKTRKILGLLKHHALNAMEILEGIRLSSDTYKVTKRLLGHMDEPKFDYKAWQRQEEKRFYILLAKMRRDGFIKKEKFDGKNFWELTKKGLKHFEKIPGFPKIILPERKYKKEKSNDLTLVVFDIPEKEKYKRAWLRKYLVELGFEMLQKSVWIGKYQVPEDFIYDLKGLEILDNMHILKVHKTGSLINFDL